MDNSHPGNKPILWLREITTQDAPFAGGKATVMGELSRKGVLVPDGFCISARVYQETVTGNEMVASQVQSELDAIDYDNYESLRTHAAAVRAVICRVELEGGIAREIEQSYRTLAERTSSQFVAVRSSSALEDRQEASGAGQHDTFLNVSSFPLVLDSLKKCWASFWNERALAYRQAHGLSHFDASMAVLVQSMVQSEVAGVLFTRDPLTGANCFVINASGGLGEAVVSGRVTPDEYILDGQSLSELSFIPGRVNPGFQAPTQEDRPSIVNLEAEQPSGRCLSPEQVQALARLGQKIEAVFANPQDVEWAIAQGRLYALQARPVTALPPHPSASFFTDPIPAGNELWTSAFFSERFPHPVSPLGWTLIKDLIIDSAIRQPLRFTGLAHFDEPHFVRVYQGHPFVRVQAYQMMFKFFPEALLPADAPTFFPGGYTAMRKETGGPSFADFIFSVARTLLTSLDWIPWNYLIWRRFAVDFSNQVDRIDAAIDRPIKMTAAALLEQVEALNRLNARLLSLHRWSLVYANVLMALLNRYVKKWALSYHPEAASLNLVAGLFNQTTRLDQELWNLARLAVKLSPGGRQKYILGRDEDVEQPSGDPEYAAGMELRRRFVAFLQRFGHRSASLDIFFPPYRSDPGQVFDLLNASGLADLSSPAEKIERQRRFRLQETTRIKQALTSSWLERLFPLRWLYFRTGLHFSQVYMQLREDQRFAWQKSLAVQRKAFLRVAEEFAARGIFESPDAQKDIFFLTAPEVKALAYKQLEPGELRQRIAARKAEFSRLQRSYYPPFLEGNNPYIVQAPNQPGISAGALQGIPISPGIARGPARLVTSLEDLRQAASLVLPGDILVTVATDPGWTPLFSRLAGLVMETGGQLSHGAVVAREYGLPAIAGIEGATALIKDGDMLVINGSEGSLMRL